MLLGIHIRSGQAQDGGDIRTRYHPQTGKLTFLGADPRSPISFAAPEAARGMSRSELAMAAITRYASDFGIADLTHDLVIRQPQAQGGGESIRYQQVYEGVPVLAGELIVNLDQRGGLRAIAGEISPDLTIPVEPSVTLEAARTSALEVVAKTYGVDVDRWQADDGSLWIFDERLLRPSDRAALLVWRFTVTLDSAGPIRQLVLIDAQRGQAVLQFNEIDTALNRSVYDNENNPSLPLPGVSPERIEGGPASAIGDVNSAYDFAGDTYEFYLTHHGRDSIDGAGMGIVSTTRYCSPVDPCPFANAFWNGAQMVYGEGYAGADDVVAHELTHGVTQYESNLFYYYQSGAINESLSDIWGEFVDQLNGAGTDTPGVRWLMGEDVPGGAIRSMSDPALFGDPDKMSSSHYALTEIDNGGVHQNSGVNNKAAYLMTDGGSYNSVTVNGLGIPKVAAIYYEVQTNLLTSGADYLNLYEALYQACLNLMGGAEGITESDCNEVRKASDAVEMDQQPVADFNSQAAYCPASQIPVFTYFEDFEGGLGAWNTGALVDENRWVAPPTYGPFAVSGTLSLYADDYPAKPADSYAEMGAGIIIPAGGLLHFHQAYGFEQSSGFWDGGVLEYNLNESGWVDAGPLIEVNGYDGTLSSSYGNPLGGKQAFAGDSHGFISTRVNLASLAGESVRFRWRMGLDSFGYDWGWWLDDVAIYDCVPPTFEDVGVADWSASNIELLYREGYVAGCSASPMLYCPYDNLNRAASAVLILEGVYGQLSSPPYPPPPAPSFADVEPTYWGYGWIESLYTDGYTAGCGTNPLIFCPLRFQTRAEASVFFLKIMHGASYTAPPANQIFSDVSPGWWGETWVEDAYNQGLLPACSTSPLSFCPMDPLDRSWAAYMLVKAKGLIAP
jgi:Zn-dependent metalloprotease